MKLSNVLQVLEQIQELEHLTTIGYIINAKTPDEINRARRQQDMIDYTIQRIKTELELMEV